MKTTTSIAAISVGFLVLFSFMRVSPAQSLTCDLTASNDLNFLSLAPNGISSSDVTTDLSATGTINSVSISGNDWNTPSLFDVSYTHYSLASSQAYGDMAALSSTTPALLAVSTFPATVYFKLQVPNNQPAGPYSQTVTFTFDCVD